MQDILYVLFKHKWKILLCAAIGIGAAAAVFLALPYRLRIPSETARALRGGHERYRSGRFRRQRSRSENLINSEVEILTSWDLAMQVAKAVGVERLLPQSEGAADITQSGSQLFVRD